jgi:UDP-N-acetylmuramate dehydrogenase
VAGKQGGLAALAAALGDRAHRYEPLADHTAMRVGGPADLLVVCEGSDEVVGTVELARHHEVPYQVIGSGCNILVADDGIRGLVVVYRAGQIGFEGLEARVEAGAPMSLLARESVARGLAGLEWASGLPGTVGGAIVGNAGAFAGDVASVLRRAALLERSGRTTERAHRWFRFGYRESRLKRMPAEDRPVLLEATFALTEGDAEELAGRANEILEWRRAHHPSGPTLGSTFRNPEGNHAGRLIEEAGLSGYRVGGALVSDRHANFFINIGGATATDVLALANHVWSEVRRQEGTDLQLEIELLGQWNGFVGATRGQRGA